MADTARRTRLQTPAFRTEPARAQRPSTCGLVPPRRYKSRRHQPPPRHTRPASESRRRAYRPRATTERSALRSVIAPDQDRARPQRLRYIWVEVPPEARNTDPRLQQQALPRLWADLYPPTVRPPTLNTSRRHSPWSTRWVRRTIHATRLRRRRSPKASMYSAPVIGGLFSHWASSLSWFRASLAGGRA
jgi:hypothetical protein